VALEGGDDIGGEAPDYEAVERPFLRAVGDDVLEEAGDAVGLGVGGESLLEGAEDEGLAVAVGSAEEVVEDDVEGVIYAALEVVLELVEGPRVAVCEDLQAVEDLEHREDIEVTLELLERDVEDSAEFREVDRAPWSGAAEFHEGVADHEAAWRVVAVVVDHVELDGAEEDALILETAGEDAEDLVLALLVAPLADLVRAELLDVVEVALGAVRIRTETLVLEIVDRIDIDHAHWSLVARLGVVRVHVERSNKIVHHNDTLFCPFTAPSHDVRLPPRRAVWSAWEPLPVCEKIGK